MEIVERASQPGDWGDAFERPHMIRLLRRRSATRHLAGPVALGHLENKVMEVLWTHGDGNVRDVAQRLGRPLAYTTVMTTLDRLFKKGLLERRKEERAFFYSPRLSQQQWEHRRAGEFVAGFLAGPQRSGELLISCLVDAVGERDEELLDELERKIQLRRQELDGRRKR